MLALRFGCTVRELRRRMTRREFYEWLAFARVYPVLEAAPPEPEPGDLLTPDVIAKAKANRT